MSTQKMQQAATRSTAGGGLRRPPRPTGKLKPERIQLELQSMPGWRLVSSGNALARTRTFTQPGAAAKWASYVADLAATERHGVTLGVSGKRVILRLQRPRRNGINLELLDFARQLG